MVNWLLKIHKFQYHKGFKMIMKIINQDLNCQELSQLKLKNKNIKNLPINLIVLNEIQ
jgi:hypothetical protein